MPRYKILFSVLVSLDITQSIYLLKAIGLLP